MDVFECPLVVFPGHGDHADLIGPHICKFHMCFIFIADCANEMAIARRSQVTVPTLHYLPAPSTEDRVVTRMIFSLLSKFNKYSFVRLVGQPGQDNDISALIRCEDRVRDRSSVRSIDPYIGLRSALLAWR